VATKFVSDTLDSAFLCLDYVSIAADFFVLLGNAINIMTVKETFRGDSEA